MKAFRRILYYIYIGRFIDSFFIPSNNFRVNSRRINLSASAASDRRPRIDDVAVVPPSSVRGCVLQI